MPAYDGLGLDNEQRFPSSTVVMPSEKPCDPAITLKIV